VSKAAERRAISDKRVAEDTRNFGCHVISVFDPDGKTPTFSYSVGIQETTGSPEVIVIGLSATLGHTIVNEYLNQVRTGAIFQPGTPYAGFLKGFPVYIEPADSSRLEEYTLGCTRYYADRQYRVSQIIYPTTSGIWPWEGSASEWFKNNQPMLGRSQPNL
jgi:hypothetical protein